MVAKLSLASKGVPKLDGLLPKCIFFKLPLTAP